MDYKLFESVILKLKEQDAVVLSLNEKNVSLIDFVSPYYSVIEDLIKEIYGEEGHGWWSWFCYENSYGEGKLQAWCEKRNPICYDIKSLWEFMEKLKDGYEVEKEYILCSATWYKELPLVKPEVLQMRGFAPYNVNEGVVLCGWRHANCLYQKVAITGLADSASGKHVQGFLTNKNRFVNREEGGKIAYAAGQTKELKKTLYSEDLY